MTAAFCGDTDQNEAKPLPGPPRGVTNVRIKTCLLGLVGFSYRELGSGKSLNTVGPGREHRIRNEFGHRAGGGGKPGEGGTGETLVMAGPVTRRGKRRNYCGQNAGRAWGPPGT